MILENILIFYVNISMPLILGVCTRWNQKGDVHLLPLTALTQHTRASWSIFSLFLYSRLKACKPALSQLSWDETREQVPVRGSGSECKQVGEEALCIQDAQEGPPHCLVVYVSQTCCQLLGTARREWEGGGSMGVRGVGRSQRNAPSVPCRSSAAVFPSTSRAPLRQIK